MGAKNRLSHLFPHGAVAIESILALPILFTFMFGFLWTGILLNARVSLASAVNNSVRLAATRGNPKVVNTEILPAIHESLEDDEWNGEARTLLSNLDSNSLSLYDMWLHSSYNDDGLSLLTLGQQFPEYIYALVYVNEAMRHAVGANLKFPCEPDVEPLTLGCMKCVFVDTDSATVGPDLSLTLECTYSALGVRITKRKAYDLLS